jgi:SWI/SNF-related matrix-associated actin-dependent regulator of chromatin subfamily A containing DEAD/H box 1
MTALQKAIYRDALQRSRKAVLEVTATLSPDTLVNGKGKKGPRDAKRPKDTSTNVLMDLRKAASHPMLFRRLFDDAVIKVMAKQCMKEPEFSGSNYDFIVEDMEVMTDAELQAFSLKYKVGGASIYILYHSY